MDLFIYILCLVLMAACFTLLGWSMAKGVGISAILGVIYGVVVAGLLWLVAAEIHEDRAVKHGHAEFYLDESHNRQWRWLPPCDNPGGVGCPVPVEEAR